MTRLRWAVAVKALVVILLNLAASMEDTCERVKCGARGWECRNLRVCERSGLCNIAVPTCVYKDTSRYRVPNICPRGGQPVVDSLGKEVTCGGRKDCPVGFSCTGGVCCPGMMADVALPMCQSLVKPNYNLPLFSTLEVCANHCTGNSDCGEEQICCFRSCGSKCVKIDPKAEARSSPVIVTASSLSSAPGTSSSSSSLSTTGGLHDVSGVKAGADDEEGEQLSAGVPPRPDQYVLGLTRDAGQQPIDPDTLTDSFSDDQQSQSASEEIVAPQLKIKDTPSSSDPKEGTGYSIGSAEMSRPKVDNSQKGPIPARTVRVDAPGVAISTNGRGDESNYPEKSGSCPANPTMVICGQRPCNRDALCPGPTKCCPTRCGQVCVTPQASAGEFNGRLGRLQGTLFRDIGAGNRPASPSLSRDDRFSNPTNPGVFGRTLRNYGVDFGSESSRARTAPNSGSDFLELSNTNEASGEGLYDPKEGPLFQYGFRSPGADNRRISARPDIASLGSRVADPSSRVSQNGIFADGFRSNGIASVGALHSVNENSKEQDRSRKYGSDDVISNAVQTAFRLNPPSQPPNNARRSMSSSIPRGGLLGGYALSFPDSQSSFPGYTTGSGTGVDSGGAGIGFNSRVASSPFGGFPGYGPSGFLDSSGTSKGLGGYDTVDAGAFGNIKKGDYKKLGLDTVTNSFNKTNEYKTRSSNSKGGTS